jgi:hypothetical protein
MSLARLSLLDAFRWRHAVRSFGGGSLTPELQSVLDGAVALGNSSLTPFSTPALLRTIPAGAATATSVVNETGWILPLIPSDTPQSLREASKIDAAVRGQIAMMELSRHRIGTIWLASYDRRAADRIFPGFVSAAAMPYGLGETAKLSLRNKMARFLSQPQRRKPIHGLFWDTENARPYTEETAGAMLPFLQALRSSPSAVNRQPWKFAVDGARMHVFKTASDYAAGVDVGIALGNIQVLAIENGHQPAFVVVSPTPPAFIGGTYVCSVTFRD